MRYLLDISVAIHLRDGDPAIQAWVAGLDDRPLLSVVTRVELEGGIHVKPEFATKRRLAVDALLDILKVLDFDSAAANRYADIIAVTGFSRRKVIDRMIAATAITHQLTLATMNGADFANVPGLNLEILPTP